jgi:hypothetical protein
MRRKEYLKKKFEYYQHMKGLRREESKYLIKRLKLEIVMLESRVRSKLVSEMIDHFKEGKMKLDVIKEVKERIYTEVAKELKGDIAKSLKIAEERLFGKKESKKPFVPMKDREGWRPCHNCKFYGECDHQGAYQKDGKWCFEDKKTDLSGEPAKESLMEEKNETNSGTGS